MDKLFKWLEKITHRLDKLIIKIFVFDFVLGFVSYFLLYTGAFAKCRKLYMGHDLLPSDEQEQVLRKNGIEISIIPDYYYRDLQEG